jgi:hypothetical protein
VFSLNALRVLSFGLTPVFVRSCRRTFLPKAKQFLFYSSLVLLACVYPQLYNTTPKQQVESDSAVVYKIMDPRFGQQMSGPPMGGMPPNMYGGPPYGMY